MSDWFTKIVTKVIRANGVEQINQPALNLVAGDGVELTAENRSIQEETRVTVAVKTDDLAQAVAAALAEDADFIQAVASAVDDLNNA